MFITKERNKAKQTFKLLGMTTVIFGVILCIGAFAPKAYAKTTAKAKKITISNVSLSTYCMKKGYSKRLKVTFSPKTVSNKKLKWKSSNKKIATVKNGVVKAKKNGAATITATTRDGSKKKAKIKIIVGTPVKKLTPEKTSVKISSGYKKTILVAVSPSNASLKTLKYSSSNKSVAHVSSKGVITARKSGTAYITVTSGDSRKTTRIKIKSYYASTNYTMKKAETVNAKDICYQKFLTYNKTLTYSSSNTKIATISAKGVITPKKNGTVTITVASKNSKQTLINLTVGTPTTGISIAENNSTININTTVTHTLSATVLPSNATSKALTYSSSNAKIATVSSNGIVTGVSVGSAKITITSQDTRSKLTVKVNVYNPAALTVTTKDGKVKGYNSAVDITAWHDVPYAKPPVDDLRWKAPQDNDPWSGTLTCTTTSKKCSQYSSGVYSGSEDCLYLNVNRPNTDETGLPVIVYMHGGSNVSGNKSSFNTKNMVRRGNVIWVSINYRLGAFGYFSMEALKSGDPLDDSGNYAILDIKKALEWVQDNIEQFGGDKNNVTLAGFSAGAKNVASCLISPLFKGLFHKAVMLSGSANEATVEQAQSSAKNAVARALVSRGAVSTIAEGEAWIDEASDDELKDLLYSFTSLEVSQFFSTSFNATNAIRYAIKDGYVIPSDGFDVVRTGDYNKVPLLMGSCESEFSGFLLANSYFSATTDTQNFLNDPDKTSLALTTLLYTNKLYAGYNVETTARAFAAAQSEGIYCYRFSWGINPSVTGNENYSKYIGAHHGSDIDFFRGTFTNNHPEFGEIFTSDNLAGRTELSVNMMKYLANFIYNSNPNGTDLTAWSTWNNSKSLMNLKASKTADTSKMSTDIYLNEYIWPELEHAVDAEFLTKYINWRFFGLFRNLFWWIDETYDPNNPDDTDIPINPDDSEIYEDPAGADDEAYA